MKKHLIIAGLFIVPISAICSESVYVAAYCTGSYSNSTIQSFCTYGNSISCTSSATSLPHVTSGGTYKNYVNCVTIETNCSYPAIICFTDSNLCSTIKDGCASGYYGTVPSATLSDCLSGTIDTMTNMEQFECCAQGSCVGYSYTTYSDVVGATLRKPKSCSASGTCSTTGYGRAMCDIGYYSAAGTSYTDITTASLNPRTPMASLRCTSCATATDNDAATSAYASASITNCYLPTDTAFDDTTGEGEYTNNCYYEE